MKSSDLLGRLPSVNDLLDNPRLKSAVDRLNQSVVATRVRSFLDELRTEIAQRAEDLPLPSLREVVDRVTRYVTRDDQWRLKGVVNATGRLRGGPWAAAPLADAAVERVLLLSKDYAVESPNPTAASPPGTDSVAMMQRLTGAEAAAVFHSRAGAISLLLTEMAFDPPVVIARGELGEVDPGCRLTDLCDVAGARLSEVGATDTVAPEDYASVLSEDGGLILRLAPEEYRLVGAPPRPDTAAIAAVARQHGALLAEDLAGGPLVELPGLEGVTGPSAAAALAAGADLVLLRGDGLIGGPECCIVLGKKEMIDRLLARPMAAVHRPSAATVAALAATLNLFSDIERALHKIPLHSLLSSPLENLRNRCERLAPQIADSPLVSAAEIVELPADTAAVSGLPYSAPSVAIALTPTDGNPEGLASKLREGTPGLWGRVDGDRLLLDLRTVFPRQDLQIVSTFSPQDDAASRSENGEFNPPATED